MEKDAEELAREVYDRTALHACLCFDTPDEIKRAMAFINVLIRRGVIKFNEESNTPNSE